MELPLSFGRRRPFLEVAMAGSLFERSSSPPTFAARIAIS
jgi:hypothetical protein